MKKNIIIIVVLSAISFAIFFITSSKNIIANKPQILLNKVSSHAQQASTAPQPTAEKIAEENNDELQDDFTDVTKATKKILKANNDTLIGAFKNDDDARNIYLKYMGEENIKELSFVAFNPDCIRACGRIIVDNSYTIRILKDGTQPRQDASVAK